MYNLRRAMKIVHNIDNTPSRIKVFEDIASRHKIIAFVFAFYNKVARTPLGPLLLMAYGAKCFLGLGRPSNNQASILSISAFANERHANQFIAECAPNIDFDIIPISKKYWISPYSWGSFIRYLPLFFRTYRIARHISRRYSFMPSCRIFSVLALYLRCKKLLSSSDSKAVLVASNYSPESLALAAAAHALNKKVIYTNHANVPANTIYVPPVYADLSILTGTVTLTTYKKRASFRGELVLKGLPGVASSMQYEPLISSDLTAGIFLTAMTNMQFVDQCIRDLQELSNVSSILIRPHPVSLVNNDFSSVIAQYSDITVSQGRSLSQDIAACDFILSGNSGVPLEILRGGKPVIYLGELDTMPHDFVGFISEGLIPETAQISEQVFLQLINFYSDVDWKNHMKRYDASYLEEPDAIARNISKSIQELL